jgi:hypothetical protein
MNESRRAAVAKKSPTPEKFEDEREPAANDYDVCHAGLATATRPSPPPSFQSAALY